MSIYTKTGDSGQTGVIGGRLPKDHPRVAAYGTVDELNAFVGLAMAAFEDDRDADLIAVLSDIQQTLFDCCADLATLDVSRRPARITTARVESLECLIDQYDQETEPIEYFILPGGSRVSALLHVCRTIARRAERCVVTLTSAGDALNPEVMRYLNRLSDLFFVLARVGNTRAGVADSFYTRSRKVFRRTPLRKNFQTCAESDYQ